MIDIISIAIGALRRVFVALKTSISGTTLVLICVAYAVGSLNGVHSERSLQKIALAQRATGAAVAEIAQAQAAERIVTNYVDRVRIVRQRGADIIKEVPVYVPTDSNRCALPGGWRLLHDAAAGDYLPDATSIADAPPADAQTAAATVADNYATCHAVREQLAAIQQFERERAAVGDQ